MQPAMAAMERHSWRLSLPRSLAGPLHGRDNLVLTRLTSSRPISLAVPRCDAIAYRARCDSVATASSPFAAGWERIKRCRRKSEPSGSAPRVQAALSLLRDHHERVTRARQAVIEVLDGTEEHLGSRGDRRSRRGIGSGSSPGDGLSGAVDTRRPRARHPHPRRRLSHGYHLAVPEPTDQAASAPHAHLQCTNCQAVIDIPVEVLDSLISRVDREVGFQVEPHHAALLGLCADCRRDPFPKAGHGKSVKSTLATTFGKRSRLMGRAGGREGQ